ncbi:alcohol dehydrogenase GroES-like domain-containing protein [Colletotrichum orchidophilum]|uniref:Alcohol dehydrogenase GroES-like domain-containing protein n=1 Tax=Colletotrichum orchidophilum TaxID=1209926 RepID=A0A1G4AMN0_9PEZI|nr:alcohol dehydrogenase GroES-like domain-containing protein [Colletotrichum orchidophilum]OHE90440.1 alcohol dehydrogenase GroES-like domain-containing protein [Colletotrichum orchidophilum]
MQAFQFEEPDGGLHLRNVPIPQPGPGQVQLRVKAAGLCHSDCHILKGKDVVIQTPITLGHEVSGIITTLGPDVKGFSPGDRVSVGLFSYPIEVRDWTAAIGLSYDGGYAEYALAPVSRLVRIPDVVSFPQAAVATDAMATSYHAVVIEAAARPGMTIGIIGIGGLGMSGLGFAALKGANVYGIDIAESKFKEAKRLGARGCFKSLDDATEVEFDIFVDFAGTGETTKEAIETVREGGKVVVVGLANAEIMVPSYALVGRSVKLVGSIGASENDLRDVFELLANKSIEPELNEIPFAEIPAGLDALDRGEARGRLWADPSKIKSGRSKL